MTQKVFIILLTAFLTYSCQERKESKSDLAENELAHSNQMILSQRAAQNLDSLNWDKQLFKQDIDTYNKYSEIFQSYPLNKSPFPVAEYDYAVSYIPFTLEIDGKIVKCVRIGECKDPDCEEIINKLTLLVLTNDEEAEESTLVDSRNFPYLTAQGYIKVSNNAYDWVFSSSPDGFSILMINMKLFDLRFGETIVIYPQINKSFLYDQIKESPNNYNNFEEFKTAIVNNLKVKNQLNSKSNIN